MSCKKGQVSAISRMDTDHVPLRGREQDGADTPNADEQSVVLPLPTGAPYNPCAPARQWLARSFYRSHKPRSKGAAPLSVREPDGGQWLQRSCTKLRRACDGCRFLSSNERLLGLRLCLLECYRASPTAHRIRYPGSFVSQASLLMLRLVEALEERVEPLGPAHVRVRVTLRDEARSEIERSLTEIVGRTPLVQLSYEECCRAPASSRSQGYLRDLAQLILSILR